MNYNSKTLLDVKFSKNVKGYDALEVDETLDQVIEDYAHYEKENASNILTIKKLSERVKELEEDALEKEIEIKKLKKQVDSIPNDPNVSRQNIQYLQRISALENALYKRGVDPKKI